MERRVTIRSAGGRLVAVKTATGAQASANLALEAELLRRSAHPGVVAVVSFSSDGDRAELILGAPSEHTVADQMPETLRGCLDFVAAIAGIVADLHAMGVAHGALRPDHILVGAHGQPVLCGFGAAQSVVDPRLFSADVIAIGELLAWIARRMPQDARNARRVTAVVARSRERGTTARALAFALADGRRDAGESRSVSTSRRSALGALLALAAIATGAALFADDGSSSTTAPSTTAPGIVSSSSVAATDAPRLDIGGVSYEVGQPGDLAYFVPCHDSQRVVLVRPGTGDIFVFDHLAEPGAPRTSQSVGRVAGALEIVPGADDSCADIGVTTEHSLVHVPVPTSTRST
jgi:serine/threonine protein kinase